MADSVADAIEAGEAGTGAERSPCSLPPRPCFLAICQGLGLAIAVGLIIGVVFPPIMPTWGAVVGAAPLGVLAAGAALNGADEAVWPALPIGVIGGRSRGDRHAATSPPERPAAQRDQVTGAEVQAPSGVTVIVVLAAARRSPGSASSCEPFSLVVLAGADPGSGYSRRRQAERKHEGLRVLR